MSVEGWKYYNHAAIPTTAPHEIPNMKPIMDGSIWKVRGGVLLFWRDGRLTLIVDMKQIGGTALRTRQWTLVH